jgi:hypothetical protein
MRDAAMNKHVLFILSRSYIFCLLGWTIAVMAHPALDPSLYGMAYTRAILTMLALAHMAGALGAVTVVFVLASVVGFWPLRHSSSPKPELWGLLLGLYIAVIQVPSSRAHDLSVWAHEHLPIFPALLLDLLALAGIPLFLGLLIRAFHPDGTDRADNSQPDAS